MTTKRARKPPGRKRKEGKLTEPKRKLNLSDEERERRSNAMKKKHAEGLAGAEFGKLGGRPKKKRASQVVAEEAQENGELIAQVFVDAMDQENPHSIRMKAASEMVKIEKDEARLQLDEAEALRKMDHDQLVAAVAEKFASNPMVLNIFKQAGEAKNHPAPEIGTGDEEEVVDAVVVS